MEINPGKKIQLCFQEIPYFLLLTYQKLLNMFYIEGHFLKGKNIK
jgi:hypothetical protein